VVKDVFLQYSLDASFVIYLDGLYFYIFLVIVLCCYHSEMKNNHETMVRIDFLLQKFSKTSLWPRKIPNLVYLCKVVPYTVLSFSTGSYGD